MEGKDLSVGGMIELKDKRKLQIIDKVILLGKDYLMCVDKDIKTKPIIIEYKMQDNDLMYRIENDKKTLLEIYSIIYKKSSKPYGI